MVVADRHGPRVVWVGMNLDRLGRPPEVLLQETWRDFGRTAAAAHDAGAQVTIVQAAWRDWDTEACGVPCHFVSKARLLEHVRALTPDLIHFEGLVYPRGLRALAAALPRVPILVQDHGTKCPRGWRRWLYRWGFAPIAGVTFTAREQAEPFTRAGILRRGLPIFEVVEISSPFTPGDHREARARADLDGDPCLFWAGNLDANKDPLMLLDAVAQAASVLPDLRLHMCFRYAPLLDVVQERISIDPLLSGRVRILGPVPLNGMETLYRAADFLVQASHAEGSSGAVIEAFACGTTPLVTDIPSLRRLTGEGQFGALVPVGDARAMAGAIREWTARDRATLRRQAREHFERCLSYEAIGRQLRAAYDAVLAAD